MTILVPGDKLGLFLVILLRKFRLAQAQQLRFGHSTSSAHLGRFPLPLFAGKFYPPY